MTKKARTGKLYSEVEGEILMENAPDDMMTKENNENEEKMTEIEDIRASHDVDAIMTDDKEEEIIFGTTTSTESDSKDTSSSASSSVSSTSASDSKSDASSEVVCKSDASSEVVCTKVIQGEEYEKPDDWSSDDDAIVVQGKSPAPKANKDPTVKGKHGHDQEDPEVNPDDEGFTAVTHKTNKNNNNNCQHQQQQQQQQCHLACSNNDGNAILESLSLLQHAKGQITATHQNLLSVTGGNFMLDIIP